MKVYILFLHDDENSNEVLSVNFTLEGCKKAAERFIENHHDVLTEHRAVITNEELKVMYTSNYSSRTLCIFEHLVE